MDQEHAFIRSMEIWAELEGLRRVRDAFVEIAQDSGLTTAEEANLIMRFDDSLVQVNDRFRELKTIYIDLIATLN